VTKQVDASVPVRILIVRLSALGDVVATFPAYHLLRQALPGAVIAWAIEAPFASLVKDLPGLDRVVLLRTKRWRTAMLSPSTTRETVASIRALRDFRADTAVDFQGTLKSAVAARLSGAPRRIGLADEELRERGAALFYTERGGSPDGKRPRHSAERGIELAATVAQRLGGSSTQSPSRNVSPSASHLPSDENGIIERFIGELGSPFVLLQPGAGWKNKEWGTRRFADLSRILFERRGLRSVVAWGPEEMQLAKDVIERSGGSATIAPPTKLPEFAYLATRASAVIGGDTGPMHLAAAVGAPTVGIFGPTVAAVHGPWGPKTSTVEAPLACRPCNRRYGLRKPCLEAILVESVANAVIKLIS